MTRALAWALVASFGLGVLAAPDRPADHSAHFAQRHMEQARLHLFKDYN